MLTKWPKALKCQLHYLVHAGSHGRSPVNSFFKMTVAKLVYHHNLCVREHTLTSYENSERSERCHLRIQSGAFLEL